MVKYRKIAKILIVIQTFFIIASFVSDRLVRGICPYTPTKKEEID